MYDYEYAIFSILRIAHAWTSVIIFFWEEGGGGVGGGNVIAVVILLRVLARMS